MNFNSIIKPYIKKNKQTNYNKINHQTPDYKIEINHLKSII